MAFSAVDAAVSGVRLSAKKPATVAVWSVGVLLTSLATTGLMVAVAGPELARISTPAVAGAPDWRALGLAYAGFFLVAMVAAVLISTAVYRAVLKPGDSRFAYLRLGADELRMAGLFVVLVAIYLLVAVLLTLGVTLVIAVLGAASGAGFNSGVVGILVVVLIFIAMFAVAAWLGVRLSLAGPMTLDTGHIRIGAAWRLTRGRFWPLLGAFALSWVLVFVVWILSTTLAVAVAAAVGGIQGVGEVLGLGRPMSGTTLQTAFSPLRLVYMVAASALGGVYYAVWLAPAAAAYRALRPDTDVSETFA